MSKHIILSFIIGLFLMSGILALTAATETRQSNIAFPTGSLTMTPPEPWPTMTPTPDPMPTITPTPDPMPTMSPEPTPTMTPTTSL